MNNPPAEKPLIEYLVLHIDGQPWKMNPQGDPTIVAATSPREARHRLGSYLVDQGFSVQRDNNSPEEENIIAEKRGEDEETERLYLIIMRPSRLP